MNDVVSKLQRIMSPQTAEDYGLSVSRAELMAVPEFSEAITEVERSSSKSTNMFKDCLQKAENARAGLALKVLMGGVARPSMDPRAAETNS